MQVKTYFRVVGHSQFKILVLPNYCLYYKRIMGTWILIPNVAFQRHAAGTPLEARLNDGSFFEMIRKGL